MQENNNDIELESSILHVMAYFDIFQYPITACEILKFMSLPSTQRQVERVLMQLTHSKTIFQFQDLYSLREDIQIFERRRRGNRLAEVLAPQFLNKAKTIFKFPFVRGVLASGSFSKNYMDESSDFDFFIICSPKRIWISRMLLVLYKRIFLANSHKHFCVNYFIDERNLEITEKNIYSATEFATVIPLVGEEGFEHLLVANKTWVQNFFPNFEHTKDFVAKTTPPGWKTLIESLIDILSGDQINKFFMRVTLKRWKRAYSKEYSQEDFQLAFMSTEGVSKNHPRNFQKKIISEYDQRVHSIARKLETV